MEQARIYLRDFHARVILILYVVGPRADGARLEPPSHNVLLLDLVDLLDRMRTNSFARPIRVTAYRYRARGTTSYRRGDSRSPVVTESPVRDLSWLLLSSAPATCVG